MKNDKFQIYIHRDAMQIFHKYRKHGICEAGGILLGQVRKREIFILKATEPSRWDIRYFCGFVRKKHGAQKIIDIEFEKSGGRTIYLGEWHSHPETIPYPSPTDREMICQQFHKNEINENFLVMIIIGQVQDYCSIYNGTELLTGTYLNAPKAMTIVTFNT